MMPFRPLVLIATCGLFSLAVNAQKQTLTLKDAVLKAGTDLAPKRLQGLQWIPNTETYCYVKGDTL